MKKCSKCGTEKELEEFHFQDKKLNIRKSACKKCNNKTDRTSSDHEIINGKKYCSKCKVNKPISEFGKFDKSKNGYSYRCNSCNIEASTKYSKKIKKKYLKKEKFITLAIKRK